MAIKNYSSGVNPTKSIGNIQSELAGHNAKEVSIQYEAGKPVALSFKMMINDVIIPFRLTVNIEGLLQAMKEDKKVPKSACNYEQAERTAWKNKYEWLRIQLAEIATNQATMEKLLLGYAVTPSGKTLFEACENNQQLLIE